MDIGAVAAIAAVGMNVVGWAFAFGKLNGRVRSLEQTAERHEKVLSDGGVVQKLSQLQSQVSELEGTVRTYIELKERD
jgi:hypothetical protein